MTTSPELVVVRLERLPLELMQEASEHQDELRREFALIQQSSSLDEASVPLRLLRLVDELGVLFAAFSEGPRSTVAAALERGDDVIDLEYRIPPHAREACIHLGELLDDADEFCRNGEHLVTLATEAGPLALRRWFLGEFVAQIDGADPTPWDEWDAPAGP